MACNCNQNCQCNNNNESNNNISFQTIDNNANINDFTLTETGKISANENVVVVGLGNGRKSVVPSSSQLMKDYFNKVEINSLLDEKTDKLSTYNKEEVDNKIIESERNIGRNEILVNALSLKANKNEVVSNEQLQIALADYYRKREVYNKDEMNAKLDTKASITEVYNKNVLNNLLADKVSSNEIYNKKEMNTFLDAKANKNEVYSRNDVYTKFEIDAKISHLDKFDDALYYDRNIIDIKLNDKADKDEFYTKLEMDFVLDKKVDKLEISNTKNDLSVAIDKKMDKFTYNAEKVNFAAKQDVYSRAETYNRSEIDVKLASLSVAQPGQQQPVNVDLSNYYTKDDVNRMNAQKADITLIGDLAATGLNSRTNVADALTEVKSSLDAKVSNVTYALEKQQFATKTELTAKADTNDLRATLNLIGDRSEMPSTSDTITTNIRLLNSRLSNKIDVGEKVNFALKVDTYTKAEVDSAIARVSTGGTVDLRNYYNRQEIDDKIGLLVSTGLTGVSVADQLADAKRRIDAIPTTGGGSAGSVNVDLSNYYTKLESDAKYALITDLNTKADASLIGTLGNTGVTGATVEAQLTEVKRLIDGLPAGGSAGGNGQDPRIGDLSNLTTTEKSTVVGAINELAARPAGGGSATNIGDLTGTGLTGSTVTELLTDVKTRIDTKADSSIIGNLRISGLTGSTVTELLTALNTKIDSLGTTVPGPITPTKDYVRDGLVTEFLASNYSSGTWNSTNSDISMSVLGNQNSVSVDSSDGRLININSVSNSNRAIFKGSISSGHPIRGTGSSDAPTELTINFLMKVTTPLQNWHRYIATCSGAMNASTATKTGIAIVNTLNQVMKIGDVSGAGGAISLSSPLSRDTVHMITIVYTADGVVKIYVDGVESVTYNRNGSNWNFASNTLIIVGGNYDGSSSISNGNISYGDILIYNRALSQDEINQNVAMKTI